MWCVTPKKQRENIKLTVILTFIEPCNMPGIKCFIMTNFDKKPGFLTTQSLYLLKMELPAFLLLLL